MATVAEWVYGDLNDPAVCEQLLSEQDVLVHLAWHGVPLTGGSFAEGLESGLVPTLRLLDAARRRPGLHIVFPSSGGTVYGDLGDRRHHLENDRCQPTSPYAIQKLAAEGYIQCLCAGRAASARILRVSTTYGWIATPGMQQGFIGVALAAALAGRPIRLIGDPENVRDFVHRDDVAAALLAAAVRPVELGRADVINIGSGVGTSVRDVLRLLEDELGTHLETQQEHWETSRGLPGYAVLDIARAAELLGWTPQIALREGIRLSLRETQRAAA
jgi:UDP-glucose 4-epimerase